MSEDDSVEIVLNDFIRRFDNESRWIGDLESKTSSMLGFIGIFMAVLFSLAALSTDEIKVALTLLAMPILLLIVSANLLFIVLFGYSTAVGPSLGDIFEGRKKLPYWLKTGLLVGYGTSILTNRILFAFRVLLFQIAVLLVAISILQLGFNLLATALNWLYELNKVGITDSVGQIVLYCLPALVVISIISSKLIIDYRLLNKRQKEDLNQWKSLIAP